PHLRGALKRLGLMMMHTALLSAAITLFTDVVYGALAGHFWFLFLTLWLYVVAVCLAITGIAELAGPLASIVLIGLFIVFGNTSSGGAVPRPRHRTPSGSDGDEAGPAPDGRVRAGASG